ncbi:MAG: thrombospondin type 3 repeat-containing protein [Acidimicrobiia bacterium]
MVRRFLVILLVLLFGAFLLGSAYADHGDPGSACESEGSSDQQNPHCDYDGDGTANGEDACPEDAGDPDANNDGCDDQQVLGPGGGQNYQPQNPSGNFDGDGSADSSDDCDLIPEDGDLACDTEWSDYLINGPWRSEYLDQDGDGVVYDNCSEVYNPNQADSDNDGTGDACEPPPPPDTDGDGTPDSRDLDTYCPEGTQTLNCQGADDDASWLVGYVQSTVNDAKPSP